jgi:hypothetical protein
METVRRTIPNAGAIYGKGLGSTTVYVRRSNYPQSAEEQNYGVGKKDSEGDLTYL